MSGENGVSREREVGKRAGRIYIMRAGGVKWPTGRILEPDCLGVNVPLTHSVTLGKLINLSAPHFLLGKMG